MATVVSKPPTGPRLKRPPVPSVQTGTNAARSAAATQSPSTPSKRPPSATTPTINQSLNGAGTNHPRAPARRSSQRPAEPTKPNRSGKSGEPGLQIQRTPEPYVRTSEYILNKYAKQGPSLVVHLHPTHFRFDQQDGSWSYTSQMKVILEHIRKQTIPPDLVDELLRSGIHFYEGCLIVQVHDYRHAAATKAKVSKDEQKENHQPFSMHKHSKFLVPSPYVPFPLPKQLSPAGDEHSQGASAAESNQRTADKEGDIRSDGAEERVFTTVMFPSMSNLSEELIDFAQWADQVSHNRNKQRAMSQKPAGQAAAFGAPAAKRQKLLSDMNRLQEAEAKVISALAPPLYLDPVEDMSQAQELLEKLRDPRFNEEPPAPKSRKRTIAELAADEALAAEEQRFMLIMDERLQPSASVTAAADTETGGATFEPRFERFKAIEEIRRQHQERQREEAEAKVQAQAEKERMGRERQAQELERQKAAAANQARQQQQAQQAQQAQHARAVQMAAQQGVQPNQHSHSHLSTTNPGISNSVHQLGTAQGHQGSPAMRNITPQSASSPINSHALAVSRSSQGGIPMAVNNSPQGSGSPPRPGSAMQHGHPVGMVPPQQPPSRNGTPHLPGGTPRLQNSTPVMPNVNGTPRMSQASPAMTSAAPTPVQGHTMLSTPQMNGRPMNQQQAAFHAQQQAARQQAMRQQAMGRTQGSPPMVQMSPALNAAQQQQQQMMRAHQQAQMRAGNISQDGAFRQQMQQMQNVGGGHMPNGQFPTTSGMPGQQQQQQQQQFNPQVAQQTAQQLQAQNLAKNFATQLINQMRNTAMSNGQTLTPELEKSMQMQAIAKGREMARHRMQQISQQARMRQQQHQQQMMMNNGMMGGNGGMG